MSLKYITYILVLIIMVFFSCKKEPEIPTGNKIEIGETTIDSLAYHTAKVSTNIKELGGNQIIQHGHCWGTSKQPTIEENKSTLGKLTQPVIFTSNITGLNVNTAYYVRTYLTSNNSTIYIGEQLIQTLAVGKAIVTTTEITDVTTNTAISGGDVTSNGNGTVTARGVCWNSTGNPSLENSIGHTTDGIGIGDFISQITGLTENTTYYVTAYVTNDSGTTYGEIKQFATLLIYTPTVSTTEITEVTTNTATSGGDITSNGNGSVTARGICWNTDGEPTLENSLDYTNDGSGTGIFTSSITGLVEYTTYYVAAYATNKKGTAYGQVKSFIATTDLIDPRDGQTYETVVIGSQKWMAENLNYQTTNSWWFNNSSANGNVYGFIPGRQQQ